MRSHIVTGSSGHNRWYAPGGQPEQDGRQIIAEFDLTQETQLGVVKLEPVLHGRQNDGIGHAAEAVGGDGGQNSHKNSNPTVVKFAWLHSVTFLKWCAKTHGFF